MSLTSDSIIWAFDAREGIAEGLLSLLSVMADQLDALLPEESDDPFEQMVADLADDPTWRLQENPRLQRMFPAGYADEEKAAEFWRTSLADQARAKLNAAATVAMQCAQHGNWVCVRDADADDWIKTLGALRVFWHAELAGPERLAEIPVDEDSNLRDIVDWLGYLLEDLLETRSACHEAGEGLDPEPLS